MYTGILGMSLNLVLNYVIVTQTPYLYFFAHRPLNVKLLL